MLELVNIVHNYDGKKLLDGVSFQVNENEALCLLGPSGGGKSTILRIIAGFETPISGEVLYNGRNIIDEPVYRRNFGMVFQDYALFPHMNVYENIAFGLNMKRISTIETEKKVKEALKQVGMEKFADRKVTELSGGEQQRVALARSLVVRPALLMLDEPLGALDYSLRQTLIGELKDILGKNGIPAIYVTHDRNEALSLSDRIAILHDGRIIQAETPEKMFEHPVNVWCANFLGFHNFINGNRKAGNEINVKNFDRNAIIKPNQTVSENAVDMIVLLKQGQLLPSGSGSANFDFVLKGLPIQNTYRGDYYDVRIKIDDNTEITISSKERLKLNEWLEIGYHSTDYILYEGNPKTENK